MLPIESYLNQIRQELEQHQVILLRASPGSGKTTRVPDYLNSQAGYRVLVLEPRRVAAVNAAQYVAASRNQEVGDSIGYQVRFDSKKSHRTGVLFVTEALLLKFLVQEAQVDSFNCIIIDEFHERSKYTDVALGVLKTLLKSRPDLKLVIMSATCDEKELVNFFKDLVLIDVPGVSHPIKLLYDTKPQTLRIDRHWYQKMEGLISQALAQNNHGSILVFVPGRGECEGLAKRLSAYPVPVFVLHGQMSLEQQKRIFSAEQERRVIISTNVAESSVTVPGVRVVIDSGLERVATWDPELKLNQLLLKRISLASHKQRAGRAARLGPGQVYLAWMKSDELSMKADISPEVLDSDLRYLILLLIRLGYTNIAQFDWLSSPGVTKINLAIEDLVQKKLIDSQFNLSELGSNILRLPLELDWSYLLSYFFKAPRAKDLIPFITFLAEYKTFVKGGHPFQSKSNYDDCENDLTRDFETAANDSNLSSYLLRTLASVTQVVSEWTNIRYTRSDLFKALESFDQHVSIFVESYLQVFPERLAQVREHSPSKFLLSSGKGAVLSSEVGLKKSPYFLVFDLSRFGLDIQIRKVMGLTQDTVLGLPSSFFQVTQTEFIEPETQRAYDLKQVFLGKLLIKESKSLKNTSPFAALNWQIKKDPSLFLSQHPTLDRDIKSWRWWCYHNKKDDVLPELIEFLIDEVILDQHPLGQLQSLDWKPYFYRVLDPETVTQWVSQCPSHIKLPTGRLVKLDYHQLNHAVEIEARLRDLFCLKVHPKICNQPIRITILGPHQRPIQITQDITLFWQSSYQEIRKELRGRYPRYPWPEDPENYIPTKLG